MSATRTAAALAVWRASGAGFAPLFLEPIITEAITQLTAELEPGARILDLGSGEGHLTHAFASAGLNVVAVDVDPALQQQARERTREASFLLGRAENLPLASASVDAVFCFSVLQYTEREAAQREILRVLRPGGSLVVIENLAGSPMARFYRLWRSIASIRYADRLTPREHLAWADRHASAVGLSRVHWRPYALLSTWLLLWPALYHARADLTHDAFPRRVLELLNRLDETLFARFPGSRGAAWLLFMHGVR